MLKTTPENVSRRLGLKLSVMTVCGAGILWWQRGAASNELRLDGDTGEEVSLVEYSPTGARIGTTKVRRVLRSESDWRSRLAPQQYYVTRRGSTDSPFTGTYYSLHVAGLYRCICCDTALFTSEAKYDSGTGWPAFFAPLAAENIREVETPNMSRHDALQIGIDVRCKRCDAHLGHIFDDGPAPTNLRYCINESALRFVPLG